MTTTIYTNKSFTLTSDAFTEGYRKARATPDGALVMADNSTTCTKVADRFPRLSTDCPMIDAMYGIAIRDHARLVIERETYFYMLCSRYGSAKAIPEGLIPSGDVFWAGYGFNTFLYTRDIAYSSWLGTAHILPQAVQSHLQYLRSLRRMVGWKVSARHGVPINGIPQEQLQIAEREMTDKFNTNSFSRRTDDIVWVLGLWEYYKATLDRDILTYMLEEFDYFDQHFYRYLFDEADGLYRGQATFIDVAGPCYPGRGVGGTVILKALSTNCLYAGCFGLLQNTAETLGQDDRVIEFAQRRDRLVQAIRKSFGAHGYPFYKDEEGGYSDRREILGIAFLALFDLLPTEQCAELLASYTEGDFGRPLVWPFYGSKGTYHDNSTWPFADTIFSLAEYKVGNKQDVIRATLGKLCRAALNGNFNEVHEYATGEFVGCPGYIWSAASYLAVVFKMIAGMHVDEAGHVEFAPVLPAELGGRLNLKGLKVGGMEINLRIRGSGEKIVRCVIDGKETNRVAIDVSPGTREIEIEIDE